MLFVVLAVGCMPVSAVHVVDMVVVLDGLMAAAFFVLVVMRAIDDVNVSVVLRAPTVIMCS